MANFNNDLPDFLRTMDAFSAHLDKQFEGDDSNKKGMTFMDFACRLAPLCDFWSGFNIPKPSPKKSHDKGVDFTADSEDGTTRFCGQSKYKIKETIEFDGIISKFANYERENEKDFLQPPTQLKLPEIQSSTTSSTSSGGKRRKSKGSEQPGIDRELPQRLRFLIITSSNLSRIRALYEETAMASKEFYRKISDQSRLEIIDSTSLLSLLQSLYMKSYVISPEVELELQYAPIKHENTYISVLSAKTLRELYIKHGSSLFFENIRDFLGATARPSSDRDDVNGDILNTLKSAPSRMLGRNNGITLKADLVAVESDTRLRLKNCSIVNGCQTTMCIVHAGSVGDNAMIAVKIVQGQDSWDVAKAANYQNRVTRIELELAKFLRPQLVRKAATELGYAVPTAAEENTVANVLDAVYKQKISYESLRYLYVGLFSRFPGNLVASNYSELRFEILNMFYIDSKNERLMRVLFMLLQRTEEAAQSTKSRHTEESYSTVFRRFFAEDKAQYRCVLAILTACGCVNRTLTKPSEDEEAYKEMSNFIDRLEIVLLKHQGFFEKVFGWAFTTLAMRIIDGTGSTPDKISQNMHREVVSATGAAFQDLFVKLRLQMANDDYFAQNSLNLDLGD